MKRLIAAAVAGLGLLAFGATTAQASPTVTLCHGIHVSVLGETIIDDAGCNQVPPEEDGAEG